MTTIRGLFPMAGRAPILTHRIVRFVERVNSLRSPENTGASPGVSNDDEDIREQPETLARLPSPRRASDRIEH
jgi:hypothetical protein